MSHHIPEVVIWCLAIALTAVAVLLVRQRTITNGVRRRVAQLEESLRARDEETAHLVGVRLPAVVDAVGQDTPPPGPLDERLAGTAFAHDLQAVIELFARAVDKAQARADQSAKAALKASMRALQGLAHEQQLAISEMQERHDHPDVLRDLLEIDHANAQFGRRAQAIAVLCGSWPGRQRVASPLTDVVRGATSRIRDYRRVRVHGPADGDLAVVSRAVEPVVLAVAELLDNAARHSQPNTTVEVGIQPVHNGACVIIDDAGVGMDGREVEEAVAMLAGRRPVDVSRLGDPPQFGFPVIGVLAARYGFSVSVDTRSPYGGVRAVVFLPATLLTQLDVDGPATTPLRPRPPETPPTPDLPPLADPPRLMPHAPQARGAGAVPHAGGADAPEARGAAAAPQPPGPRPPGPRPETADPFPTRGLPGPATPGPRDAGALPPAGGDAWPDGGSDLPPAAGSRRSFRAADADDLHTPGSGALPPAVGDDWPDRAAADLPPAADGRGFAPVDADARQAPGSGAVPPTSGNAWPDRAAAGGPQGSPGIDARSGAPQAHDGVPGVGADLPPAADGRGFPLADADAPQAPGSGAVPSADAGAWSDHHPVGGRPGAAPLGADARSGAPAPADAWFGRSAGDVPPADADVLWADAGASGTDARADRSAAGRSAARGAGGEPPGTGNVPPADPDAPRETTAGGLPKRRRREPAAGRRGAGAPAAPVAERTAEETARRMGAFARGTRAGRTDGRGHRYQHPEDEGNPYA
ncbi:ATP-binding protein [Streptomyces luteosporeus]|uniref:histidine kinase n=1 Tax=Streptomyces luteosporeus TaxID=173856 RepID=A0ABP6G1M2_9ACTN